MLRVYQFLMKKQKNAVSRWAPMPHIMEHEDIMYGILYITEHLDIMSRISYIAQHLNIMNSIHYGTPRHEVQDVRMLYITRHLDIKYRMPYITECGTFDSSTGRTLLRFFM